MQKIFNYVFFTAYIYDLHSANADLKKNKYFNLLFLGEITQFLLKTNFK